MKTLRRKPKRSLRTILIVWFLLFSVIPLAFVTIYSMLKFEKAIDHELSQRLAGNARELSVILSDYRKDLQQKRDRYVKDPSLIYHMSVGDGTTLKGLASQWLRGDSTSSLTFFNREGRMIASVFKDDKEVIRSFIPIQKNIKLVIASKIVGLTIGAGYFELRGISSEFSLLNSEADRILGNYEVTHYEAALGRGLGYFSAVKVGLPQLAYNVSVQYLSGAGVKAGIEKMVISEIK